MSRKAYRKEKSEIRKLNLHHLIEQKYNGATGTLIKVLEAESRHLFNERRCRQMMRGDVLIWPDDARRIERAVRLEEGWLDQPRWKRILDEDQDTVFSIIRSCQDGSATAESMTRLLELIARLTKPREGLPPGQGLEAG